MGQKLQNRIDTWKKLLLDFGKRNKLINFKDGKRTNVRVTSPSIEELYSLVVMKEKSLCFPFAKNVKIDGDGEESYDSIINGDLETNRPLGDLQKTLRSLRLKAKTSIEEQGINILYLTFGILKWKERDDSDVILSSPLVLVPVRLTVDSITSPYVLSLHEDEIVTNPTLLHKLENDFGLSIPEFDNSSDEIGIYFERVKSLIVDNDWVLEESINLTYLSFLKINMYKDLERNADRLSQNQVVSAMVGESDSVDLSQEFTDYDHDNKIKPIDTYSVVDADSSQQDAILLSKSGTSFVLQGPPGTGKSQTITNIISEALADGKKILFVSEKMAALQVVYNRLANVGLSEYCFTLHSHKANKKEILRDLSVSINIDRKRVKNEALEQLEILDKKRTILNNYQKQLHTESSSLNSTIFKINGELTKLKHIPEIIFTVNHIDKITQTELNEIRYLLSEFSKTIGKRTEEFSKNVWRNATVNFLSNELRHDFDSKVSLLTPKLKEINETINECCVELGIEIKHSLEGLNILIDLLLLTAKSPTIPVKWITDKDIELLQSKAEEYKVSTDKVLEINSYLLQIYREDFFNINGQAQLHLLSHLITEYVFQLKEKDKDIAINEIDEIITKTTILSTTISNLYNEATVVANNIGINAPTTFFEINFINSLSELLSLEIKPTERWFSQEFVKQANKHIEECCTRQVEINKIKQTVLQKFDKEIFEIDFYPILKRFRTEYGTIFRNLKKSYNQDISHLKEFLLRGAKLSFLEAFELLNNLKVISDKIEEIEGDKEIYISYFGSYYNGFQTPWDKLREDLITWNNIVTLCGVVPSKLKCNLLEGSMYYPSLRLFNTLYKTTTYHSIINNTNLVLSEDINEQTTCEKIIERLESIQSSATDFKKLYHALIEYRKEYVAFDVFISELGMLSEMQSLRKSLASQKQHIIYQYEGYYTEENTNWENTFRALLFAKDFKKYVDKTNLPNAFIISVCQDVNTALVCQEYAAKLISHREGIKELSDWVIELFEENEVLRTYHLMDLSYRFEECKNRKHLLEEWVDYRSNRRNCEAIGLSKFIEQVEVMHIDVEHIVDAYSKRFYRLWLDAVLPKFPAVQTFRGRIHNQTISEFKELDKKQLIIAQSRVRERVTSRIPDFNSITSTHDEIGILKRELNKQRKLLPLRKLFMDIPNLLTTLRPCFMMSPLSVSVFLEAKCYNFDLVIFDEASQVHTEDAIGAIMRGKQIIIVGDTKQLPPTNFFASTLSNDEDYDSDDETADSDAGAYQSILDESVVFLPERSLRWHYRSRHEDLIAFSNIKIYNNSLITFPSSVEKKEDCGVEYVYVSEGIYDRGGKRWNMNEAKRVAELVFIHFNKYPNKSLGVITFSEAQQQAIEAAINKIRLQTSKYENFFSEEKAESFFIKNLENVQGDERDTIIFSIGYAKDSNGIMYMNFGPLSKDGGHRRLNVAITRAKENIKLVGSITPTDIDLDRSSAEGVKLLRSYIEFAQQGIIAIQKELSYNNSLDFDSPFEESVYNFLSSRGYNVVTQVGCSGFRIDMAVKHTIINGQFALGIECDGAAYHSSRTARERDRLRQDVLESMGWTIYRIWSTDWIKDQRTEEEKLIEAIEKSFIIKQRLLFDNELDNSVIDVDHVFEETIISKDSVEVAGYGFATYIIPDLYSTENIALDLYNSILKVIEVEQPIHFEELCKRSAKFYGNQKVTSKVRNGINETLKDYRFKDKIQLKDDFVTLIDFKELKVRIPDPSSNYVRSMNHISNEEIALAMKTIVLQSFGITSENLIIATAREFGNKRTTENTLILLRKVYDEMLSCGEVTEIEGKIKTI